VAVTGWKEGLRARGRKSGYREKRLAKSEGGKGIESSLLREGENSQGKTPPPLKGPQSSDRRDDQSGAKTGRRTGLRGVVKSRITFQGGEKKEFGALSNCSDPR